MCIHILALFHHFAWEFTNCFHFIWQVMHSALHSVPFPLLCVRVCIYFIVILSHHMQRGVLCISLTLPAFIRMVDAGERKMIVFFVGEWLSIANILMGNINLGTLWTEIALEELMWWCVLSHDSNSQGDNDTLLIESWVMSQHCCVLSSLGVTFCNAHLNRMTNVTLHWWMEDGSKVDGSMASLCWYLSEWKRKFIT